jgi:hypothetical protein
MTLTGIALSLLLAAGAEARAAPPPPEAAAQAPLAAAPAEAKDPAALAAVQRMADRLAAARTFAFKAQVALEFPIPSGPLATYYNEAKISVRRPDGLSASRTGDLPDFRFAYDGKAMVAYDAAGKRWGTTAAPPTIDAMLAAAAEQGNLSFIADELIVADPYAAMTRGLTAAALVGKPKVRGKATEHVVLTSDGLQLELWIDVATALPARAQVVYTDLPARPHFTVDYAEWKVDGRLEGKTFTLPKPAGATQVEFRDAAAAFR